MAVLDVTSAARADLIALVQHGTERFGFDVAEAYANRIAAALKRLEDFPESGPRLAWRTDNVRKLTVGSHSAFFRVEGDIVRIIRILHQRMDPSRHL